MCNRVLLLGAGFSANFGVPVTRDIWNLLFNHLNIQTEPKIKERLLKHLYFYDFESFYSEILRINLPDILKDKVKQAIKEIFAQIDTKIEHAINNENLIDIDYLKVIDFLNVFSQKKIPGENEIPSGEGYIFSLNQDMLIEKLYLKYLLKSDKQNIKKIIYPGIGPIDLLQLESNGIIPPTEDQLISWKDTNENISEIPHLVKLHGSMKWIDTQNGKDHFVMGTNKSDAIKDVPILRYNFDIFSKVVSKKVDIWSIGYSFSDDHINEEIKKSLLNGSSLYIIDTKPFHEVYETLINKKVIKQERICTSLRGYYSYPLKKIFPLPALDKRAQMRQGKVIFNSKEIENYFTEHQDTTEAIEIIRAMRIKD